MTDQKQDLSDIFWVKDELVARGFCEYFRSEGGDYVRRLRIESGISYDTLTSQCEMSPAVLEHLETGQYIPSPQQLFALADVLGVKKEEMMREFYGSPLTIHYAPGQEELRKIEQSLEERGLVVLPSEEDGGFNSLVWCKQPTIALFEAVREYIETERKNSHKKI